MQLRQHPYRLGTGGRAVQAQPGGHHLASVTCGCGALDQVRFREFADDSSMDRKFIQRGWMLDPPKCPACRRKTKETKPMTSKPSPAAMRSQVQTINLLSEHFDPDAGRFAAGWDDARIGKETGLAEEAVRDYRLAGFGEIKEPPEIAKLAADIHSLERLLDEAINPIKSELAALKARVAEVRRTFAA